IKINRIAPVRGRACAPIGSCDLLSLVLCLVIWYSSLPGAQLSPRAGKADTSQQADRAARSVVQLIAVGPVDSTQNRACSSTGFLIDEEGYLVTNAHVVEDARKCVEKAPGAKILAKLTVNDPRTARGVPCDVIAIDALNDLVLL